MIRSADITTPAWCCGYTIHCRNAFVKRASRRAQPADDRARRGRRLLHLRPSFFARITDAGRSRRQGGARECTMVHDPPSLKLRRDKPSRRPPRAASNRAGRRAKKRLRKRVRNTFGVLKRFPAPCYSPIVDFTVPSPLGSLTTVFGKGTCVATPL